MVGIAILPQSTMCTPTFVICCKFSFCIRSLFQVIPAAFRYLKMKDVDELTGGESCVSLFYCMPICVSVLVLT